MPTGASGESLVPIESQAQMQTLLNFSSIGYIFDSAFFKIFIGIVILLGIWYAGEYILNKLFSTQNGGMAATVGGKRVRL